METPSLTRPPRPKRPEEVARHVGITMDAYRRMLAAGKDKRKSAGTVSRAGRL